jgi:hypothetical protein
MMKVDKRINFKNGRSVGQLISEINLSKSRGDAKHGVPPKSLVGTFEESHTGGQRQAMRNMIQTAVVRVFGTMMFASIFFAYSTNHLS